MTGIVRGVTMSKRRTMALVYGALLILVAVNWSMIGAALFLTIMDYASG